MVGKANTLPPMVVQITSEVMPMLAQMLERRADNVKVSISLLVCVFFFFLSCFTQRRKKTRRKGLGGGEKQEGRIKKEKSAPSVGPNLQMIIL